MKLRNLELTLANVSRASGNKKLEVLSTSAIRSRNSDGSFGNVEGYAIECAANHGDTLKIKLPKTTEIEEKIADLRKNLDDDCLCEVSFKRLKLTPYAMKTASGDVISGVSAKAEDFESHVVDIDDDIDID